MKGCNMKNKILSYKNKKLESYLLYGLLCMIISVIVYINFKKIKFNIDPDVFAEISYAKEVWETKTLFPMGWFPANELMFFRPTIIATLIYGITKNYILSYSISLTIILIFIIISYIYMLKAYNVNNNSILISMILLFSFGGEFRPFSILNFMIYGYYSFYTIATFITIGVIQRIYNKKQKVSRKYLCLLYVISFVSGISGIRMMIFLYVPLLLVKIINWYIQKTKGIDVFGKHTLFLAIINFLGVIFGKIFFYYTIVYQSEPIRISKFQDIGNKFWGNIVALMQAILGSSGNTEIKSFQTIDVLLKGVLFLFVLFFLYKNRKKYIENIAVLFFISYSIVIFSIKTFLEIKIFTHEISIGFYWYYYLVPCLLSFVVCDIIKIKKYKYKLYFLIMY